MALAGVTQTEFGEYLVGTEQFEASVRLGNGGGRVGCAKGRRLTFGRKRACKRPGWTNSIPDTTRAKDKVDQPRDCPQFRRPRVRVVSHQFSPGWRCYHDASFRTIRYRSVAEVV